MTAAPDQRPDDALIREAQSKLIHIAADLLKLRGMDVSDLGWLPVTTPKGTLRKVQRKFNEFDEAVRLHAIAVRDIADCLTGANRAAEAEVQRLREALRIVIHRLDEGGPDAPGHSHDIAGIWDADNGDLAGKPCEWCAEWAKARAALRPSSEGGGG